MGHGRRASGAGHPEAAQGDADLRQPAPVLLPLRLPRRLLAPQIGDRARHQLHRRPRADRRHILRAAAGGWGGGRGVGHGVVLEGGDRQDHKDGGAYCACERPAGSGVESG